MQFGNRQKHAEYNAYLDICCGIRRVVSSGVDNVSEIPLTSMGGSQSSGAIELIYKQNK